MEENIIIYCENDNQYYTVRKGISLKELSDKICPHVVYRKTGAELPVLAAFVDHKLKQLDYPLIYPHYIKFLGYDNFEGRHCYMRSLSFVLQVAVRKLFPDRKLVIDYSLPNGLYCEIRNLKPMEDGRPDVYPVSDTEIDGILSEMRAIVAADLPFSKSKIKNEYACEIFENNHQPAKAELFRSIGNLLVTIYRLGDEYDTFHGPLVPSTGCLGNFNLFPFNQGFCLQYPQEGDITYIAPITRQAKIASTLKTHSDWCAILGAKGIGSLNEATRMGYSKQLVNLCEALHEREFAKVADMIFERRDSVKVVFIAGPSSSGKTSSSLRLAIQCKTLGLNPKVIELDNYFVERSRTPKDENGEYDFESLNAMDLELLRCNLNDLFAGKEVDIPKYDFIEGKPVFNGNRLKLEEKDILIMEGIHALNPAMVQGVDESKIFRVYASALTSLSIDENNNISTSDNRLIRRIVRDNRTRGHSPESTLKQWTSVRRGENHNIFPFQENADVFLNTALLFEFPVLKYYAEPLLRRIQPNSPVYTGAVRLLKFLDYIVPFSPEDIEAIPPTSIMREFIGGQTL